MMNIYEPYKCPNCGKIFTVNRVASYNWMTPPEWVNINHFFCFDCGTIENYNKARGLKTHE